jgi:hypothetical protein
VKPISYEIARKLWATHCVSIRVMQLMSSRGSWNLKFRWISVMEESGDETKDEGYWD